MGAARIAEPIERRVAVIRRPGARARIGQRRRRGIRRGAVGASGLRAERMQHLELVAHDLEDAAGAVRALVGGHAIEISRHVLDERARRKAAIAAILRGAERMQRAVEIEAVVQVQLEHRAAAIVGVVAVAGDAADVGRAEDVARAVHDDAAERDAAVGAAVLSAEIVENGLVEREGAAAVGLSRKKQTHAQRKPQNARPHARPPNARPCAH